MKAQVLLVLPLLLLTAACGDDGDDSAASRPTPSVVATATPSETPSRPELRALRGDRWSETELTLEAGQSVTVTSIDPDAPHDFVVEGVGKSPTLDEGDSFTLSFPKAGTYRFVCTFHEARGMVGTITVR